METQRLASILSKLFAPESLAAIPEGEKGYDPKIASKVEPNTRVISSGDLILTRTSSTLYNVLRAFTGEPYDHIAVVLNHKLVLHIGPGRIRTLSLVRLLEPQRSPLVLRPILSPNEKDQFLNKCWSMIGEKYDLVRVFDFILRLILLNWTPIQVPFKKVRLNATNQNMHKNRWVCSDAVMDKLFKVNHKYKQFINNDAKSDKKIKDIMLNNLGSLTIKDFLTMAQNSDDLFNVIELPLSFIQTTTLSDRFANILTAMLTAVRDSVEGFDDLTVSQKVILGVLFIYIFKTLYTNAKKPELSRLKSNL